jgi:hypothetical protein
MIRRTYLGCDACNDPGSCVNIIGARMIQRSRSRRCQWVRCPRHRDLAKWGAGSDRVLENVDDGVNDHKSTSPLDDFWCGLRVSKSATYTYKVRSRTSLVELGAGAGGVIRRVSMSMQVGVACVRVWWSDRR